MVTGNLVLIEPLFVFTGSPLPPNLLSVLSPVPLSFLSDAYKIINNYELW